jgi:hypothetical protein
MPTKSGDVSEESDANKALDSRRKLDDMRSSAKQMRPYRKKN